MDVRSSKRDAGGGSGSPPSRGSPAEPEAGDLDLDAALRRMVLLLTTALLLGMVTVWGLAAWTYGLPFGGEIRPDPYSPRSLRFANLLYSLPHRALQTMPYVPVGARGSLTLRPLETAWLNSPGFPGDPAALGSTLTISTPLEPTGVLGSLELISPAYAAQPSKDKAATKEAPPTQQEAAPALQPQATQPQILKQETVPNAQQQQQQQEQKTSEPTPEQEQIRRLSEIGKLLKDSQPPPLPPQVTLPVNRGNQPLIPLLARPPTLIGANPDPQAVPGRVLDGTCVTEALCLLVGEGGRAALTRDGGFNWIQADDLVDLPAGFDFIGAFGPRLFDEQSKITGEAFAVTSSGLVLRLELRDGALKMPQQTAQSAIDYNLMHRFAEPGAYSPEGGEFLVLDRLDGQSIRVFVLPDGLAAGLRLYREAGDEALLLSAGGEVTGLTADQVFPYDFGAFENAAGSQQINAILRFEDGSGWAVGDAGNLVRIRPGVDMADGRMKLATAANLRSIRFAAPAFPGSEPLQGWVSSGWDDGNDEGARPVLLQTLDGGETWERLSYRRWPAPWVFLGGFLAALAGARSIGARWRYWTLRAFLEQKSRIMGTVAQSDRPIGWDDEDVLGLKPVAKALSLFIRNRDTEPPVTFGITGAWGTGKSSLMLLVAEDLRSQGARPVMFNAWHHQTEEHLLAALLETVRAQGVPHWWTLSGLQFRLRLFTARLKDMKTLLAMAFILALALVMVGLVKDLSIPELNEELGALVAKLNTGETGESAIKWVLGGLGATGATAVLLFGLYRAALQLQVITVKPAALMAQISQRAGIAQFEQQLGFRHRFQKEFGEVCRALRRAGGPGMVIFIDDLDRCRPENVLTVLESVNFLVSAGPCFVVLGIDEEKVIQSVAYGFHDAILAPPDEADMTSELKPSGRQVFRFARNYLEKLINIAVPVPLLDVEQSGTLMSARAGARGSGGEASAGSLKSFLPSSPWPRRIRRSLRSGLDLAGGLIVITFACFLVFNWVHDLLPPIPRDTTQEPASSSEDGQTPATEDAQQISVGDGKEAVAPGEFDFTPEAAAKADSHELTAVSWWWLVFLGCLAALFLALLLVRRAAGLDETSPHDRREFKYALERFLPLIHPRHPTPRAIKRFQNHTRFLAMLLRDPVGRPSWLDRLFSRRPEVLEPVPMKEEEQAIREEMLVALNALFNFDPRLFETLPAQGRPRLFQDGEPAGPSRALHEGEVEAIQWIRNNSSEDDLAAFLALRPTATTTFSDAPERPAA